MIAGRRFPSATQSAGLRRLAALCLGLAVGLIAGLGPSAVAGEAPRAASALQMRQLSKPFSVPPRLLRAHYGLRSANSRRAAARTLRGRGQARRPALPAITQLSPTLRSARERWPEAWGRTPRSREILRSRPSRRPALSADIRADQLLLTPRADGDGDERLAGVTASGIPVFRDIPPIVIVVPPRAARWPLDAPLWRPRR